MWYRSLSLTNPPLIRGKRIWGKRVHVKSTYFRTGLPFSYFSMGFLATFNWNFIMMLNKDNATIHPVWFRNDYSFLSLLPNTSFTSRNLYKYLFCTPFSYNVTTQFIPYYKAWRKTLEFLMWGQLHFKTFLRLRFRGKGYYLYKGRRKTLSFRFGYSHRVYRSSYLAWYKLMSKTEIFIWSRSFPLVWNFAWYIKSVRPYNQYTGKGIRFSRQIIYKKLGKVGSYR